MSGKFYVFVKSVRSIYLSSKLNIPSFRKDLPQSSYIPSINFFSTDTSKSTGKDSIEDKDSIESHKGEVDYYEIKQIGKERNSDEFIIDVREPEELKETGIIPGSINVPLDDLEVALKELSREEFLVKYGRSKPQKTSLVVFSCKSGKRSAHAQEVAQKLGYQKSKHYTGGWLDWEEHKRE